MSENMVQELERLRKLLDTTSPEQLKKSLARDGSGSDTAFSGALTAAEVMPMITVWAVVSRLACTRLGRQS